MQHPPEPPRRLPAGTVQAVLVGLAVAVLGTWEVGFADIRTQMSDRDQILFVCAFAVAVASYRLRPSLALGLLWALAFLQVWNGVPLLLVELSVAVIAFGCGRYGSVATLVASAASVPAIGLLLVLTYGAGLELLEVPSANEAYYSALWAGSLRSLLTRVLLFGTALLIVPWLVGVLVRVLRREARTRAEQIETARERDQAEELAEVKEGQARLARDVHDVVGHSLAVILAQAESAQYLPDDDPARLKDTLATIATSARTSLQDVRHVLGATGDRPPSGGLDTLVEGVRASGHEVISTEIGEPRPLPPELATVAYRVLQEMLTNAIRHGRRDEPLHVERHWQDELRIEVSNVVDTAGVETVPIAARDVAPAPGNGLEGMRRRLESVGGRLDVRPRSGAGFPTFTVTAWLPTSAT
ncbi:sensor histidine kinase [Nocardioides sp. MH1]|uniref:sensor histidine kinase n=1 Tax=Nocardioides sp. MH1 TaxID=3242490 RepID=UPI0035211AC3